MSSIEFIKTEESKQLTFLEKIRYNLNNFNHLDWAIAFGNHQAFFQLEKDFRNFFNAGGRARFVFDLSAGITDPELIDEFITYPGECFCKVYFPAKNSGLGIFHHKIYNFYDKKYSLLIGSSNFSISAYHKNLESSLLVTGDCTDEIFNEVFNYFENSIWASQYVISPELNPLILDTYREYYYEKSKNTSSIDKKSKKLQKVISDTIIEQTDFVAINPQLAYLMGAICSSSNNIKYDNFLNKEIDICFKSAIKNLDTEDQGKIGVRIEGKLLGEVLVEQRIFQERIVRRIYLDLKNIIKSESALNTIELYDNSKKMVVYNICVKFSDESKIWGKIKSTFVEFDNKNLLVPIIPKEIQNSKNIALKKSFLKGYFDFRSRVSKSDRYPGQYGKLRIAIQVGTNNEIMIQQLLIMLYELGIDGQLQDGSKHKRDSMIRFEPKESILELFSSGEHRILINEFIKFNNGIKKLKNNI